MLVEEKNSARLRKYIVEHSKENAVQRHSKTQNVKRVQWSLLKDSDTLEGEFGVLFPNIAIEISDKKLSGKSGLIGYEATTTKDINLDSETIPQGTRCYIGVMSQGKGVIDNKELTPISFGLADGVKRSSNEIVERVLSVLHSERWNSTVTRKEVIAPYLTYLMKKANREVFNLSVDIFKKLSPEDMLKISKDFGEILSAIRTSSIGGLVSFPIGNAPLVDYIFYDGDKVKKYSVKDGRGGAAPSLQSIENELIEVAYCESGGVKDVLVLLGSKKFTCSDKVLRLSEFLMPEFFAFLSNLCGGYPTQETITTAILRKKEECGTAERFYSWLEENVYKTIGKYSFFASIQNYFDAQKYIHNIFGCICSPLAYAINQKLNTEEPYRNVLNEVAHSLSVFQDYVNITKDRKEINFKTVSFADMEFEYFTNPTTNNPNNRSIGFRAIKNKSK
jgi:hypothetical protein